MNAPEKLFFANALPDVQATPDERQLAIHQVGVRGLRYPLAMFDADGAEVYLKPISSYVTTEREVSTATIIAAAQAKGEIAIGYRVSADSADASKAYGCVMNPPKAASRLFRPEDRVIVLANA